MDGEALGPADVGGWEFEEVAGLTVAVDKEWLTLDEAAAFLRVSRQTIYRLIGSGRLLPDGRVSSAWWFTRTGSNASCGQGPRYRL